MNRRMGVLLLAATAAGLAGAGQVTAQEAGYRGEYLRRIGALEKKFVSLAEAMPQDKYTWRPADNVRSVGEVFLHVSAANYMVSRTFGAPPPDSFKPQGFEKSTTNREQIATNVKNSFGHLRGAVEKLADGDAEKPLKLFGQQTTTRGALLIAMDHLSEHLGQAIAYARTTGTVPPWSK